MSPEGRMKLIGFEKFDQSIADILFFLNAQQDAALTPRAKEWLDSMKMPKDELTKVKKLLMENAYNSMDVIAGVDLLSLPGMSDVKGGARDRLQKKMADLKVVTDFLCVFFTTRYCADFLRLFLFFNTCYSQFHNDPSFFFQPKKNSICDAFTKTKNVETVFQDFSTV
jgi:hypothetical protein